MPPPTKLPEVNLSEESLKKIEERMARAVGDGIKFSLNEENARAFWGFAMDGLQKSATENTGRFILGGVRALIKKIFIFIALGALVYMVGGWAGLVALFKAVANWN